MKSIFDFSKFEDRIRFFLQSQGITYGEIARGCCVPVSYAVDNLRKDACEPIILEYLCEKYALNKSWLLTGKGIPYMTAAMVEVDEAFLKNELINKVMRMHKYELQSVLDFIEKNRPGR